MSKSEKAKNREAESQDSGFDVDEMIVAARKPMKIVPESTAELAESPTKWICNTILKVMSRGGSIVEAAVAIGVSRRALYNWIEEDSKQFTPEIKAAIEQGKELSMAWWEKNGRAGIWAGKQFNAAAYNFQMKNRFKADYGDQPVEHTVTVKNPIIAALGEKMQNDWDDETETSQEE